MNSGFEEEIGEAFGAMLDSELGQQVTYSQNGSSFPVRAVFSTGEGVEAQRSQVAATAYVLLSSFEIPPRREPAEADQITANGWLYVVRRVALDGVGGATLDLRLLSEAL